MEEGVDEEGMVQSMTAKKTLGRKGTEIDANHLQRRLAATLDGKVLAVLDIRGSGGDGSAVGGSVSLHECENRLLVLLGFERFDLIKVFLANRARIMGCARSIARRWTERGTRWRRRWRKRGPGMGRGRWRNCCC